MHKPLRINEIELPGGVKAFASDGSPADCVAISTLGFLEQRPELVISGINNGNNLGGDITYSGTVAAAMEAIVTEIPAIAVSMHTKPTWPVEVGAAFVKRLVDQITQHGLANDIILNVNVPNTPESEIKGVKITRLGKRIYEDELVVREDPYGHKYYWVGGHRPPVSHHEEGTDVTAVEEGYVSITPIHMDMTSLREDVWDLLSNVKF